MFTDGSPSLLFFVELGMLLQIMISVLEYLTKEEKIELTPDANIQKLATDLVEQMSSASFGSHFGSWLASRLIEHPMVEELFATDKELKNVLQDMDFFR